MTELKLLSNKFDVLYSGESILWMGECSAVPEGLGEEQVAQSTKEATWRQGVTGEGLGHPLPGPAGSVFTGKVS